MAPSNTQMTDRARPVRVERHDLLEIHRSLETEWIITNGLGGYASSTAIGVNTRRYHGTLVASTPTGRRVLVAKIDEEVELTDGERIGLSTNEFHDGTLHPAGYLHLEEMWLDGTLPTWRWRVRDLEIEKSISMVHGQNTAIIRYRVLSADSRIRLRLAPFVTDRNFHTETKGSHDWRFQVESRLEGSVVRASEDALGVGLFGCAVSQDGSCKPPWFVETGHWYWNLLHRDERARGMDDVEDLYTPGLLVFELAAGDTAWLVVTAEPEQLGGVGIVDHTEAFEAERSRQNTLLAAVPGPADPVIGRLALAADQFLIRSQSESPDDRTVIAGYYWLGDWGRDTAIALDGLCGATGRDRDARGILLTLARSVDHGMLPSRVPDLGIVPTYDSADASLWFIEAIARHFARTKEWDLVEQLLPVVDHIIDQYVMGTRCGIRVDPVDGLLRAGEPGRCVTWMDAQINDVRPTPRSGKQVELNALWFNALNHSIAWHRHRPSSDREISRIAALQDLANRAQCGFNQRFWYGDGNYCFDVVDADDLGGQSDARLRPNQLFAIALPHPILDQARWKQVLDVVDATLLTPRGLRSLAPSENGYVSRYWGDQPSRDAAYHQGSVWPWLLGAYVDAARRVRGNAWDPMPVIGGVLDTLTTGGLGTIGELFDGASPHRSGGSVSQAWSVAEMLRILRPA